MQLLTHFLKVDRSILSDGFWGHLERRVSRDIMRMIEVLVETDQNFRPRPDFLGAHFTPLDKFFDLPSK